MQAPIVFFDHINKKVASIATGPAADKRVAEMVEMQRKQIATSGRPDK